MRRLVVVGVALATLLMAVPVAAAPPDNPFVGSWEGTDPAPDFSRNKLMVGGNLHVVYHEDGLTICEIEHGQFVGGTGTAFAEIDGDTLIFTAEIYCNLRGGPRAPVTLTFEFVYDEATDTLNAGSVVPYSRSGS